MKKKSLTLCLLSATFFASAQNIGINNPTPQFPLSFNAATGDKISLWSDGTPTHYGFGIKPALLQIFAKTSVDNIAFGYGSSTAFTQRMRILNSGEYGMELNGRMVLANGTSPLDAAYGPGIWLYKADNSTMLGFMGTQNNQNMGFYGGPGGWGFTYDAINSRVGIGTATPAAKLHVSAGDASLALFGPGSTFGGSLYVGAGLNQGAASTAQVIASDGNLHIDPAPGKNLYLGYFQARDIFLNPVGGNVGIGIGISPPAYQLDLGNRMRIRSGGNNSVSAGLWLNNNANTESAFIGMEDDTHVGIFGAGTGWKFGINTQTGALKINGSEGAAGQVITSSGAAAPAWTSPTSFIYNNMLEYTQTSNITVTGFSDVPGMTQTITTPASKALITVKGFMHNVGCFGCGQHSCKYDIWVDGTLIDRNIIVVPNDGQAIITNGGKIYSLTAGSHTIAAKVDGDGKDFNISGFRLVILVIPQ